MPISIEWASFFNKDGSRRKPPASTMHGWLAKMRGTLVGDESLRSRGMREMREARAIRRYKRERKRQTQGGRSLFSFFGTRKKTSQAPVRSRTSRNAGRGSRRKTHHHRPSTARPPQTRKASGASGVSRRPTGATRRGSSRPHHTKRRGSGR